MYINFFYTSIKEKQAKTGYNCMTMNVFFFLYPVSQILNKYAYLFKYKD